MVAIILVNYNGYNDTLKCVQSIKKNDYHDYKIIIVDNASDDRKVLQNDNYLNKETDVLYMNDNLGFSAGNNRGIEYAKKKYDPDFYFLLNNDTEISKNTIKELVNTYEQYSENCGILTCKINYYSTPDIVWSAGGKFDFFTGLADQPACGKKDSHEFDGIKKITFCTGCVMFISKEIIDLVGLLDENFFLYAEDTDYCCRVMNAGYQLLYTGGAVVYHKVSASTGKGSAISQYYNIRNNLYIIKKYCKIPILGYFKYNYRIIKGLLYKQFCYRNVVKAYKDYKKGVYGKIEF